MEVDALATQAELASPLPNATTTAHDDDGVMYDPERVPDCGAVAEEEDEEAESSDAETIVNEVARSTSAAGLPASLLTAILEESTESSSNGSRGPAAASLRCSTRRFRRIDMDDSLSTSDDDNGDELNSSDSDDDGDDGDVELPAVAAGCVLVMGTGRDTWRLSSKPLPAEKSERGKFLRAEIGCARMQLLYMDERPELVVLVDEEGRLKHRWRNDRAQQLLRAPFPVHGVVAVLNAIDFD
jgi:hypothetical protein